MPAPSAVALLDAAALATNRGGSLTPAQQTNLKKLRRGAGLLILGALFLLGVAGFNASQWFAWPLSEVAPTKQADLMWDALLALAGLGLGLAQLWDAIALTNDLNSPEIAEIEGAVVWRAGRYRITYTPPNNQLPKFVELSPGQYRFFYLPHSRQLLSAELLVAAPAAESPDALGQVLDFTPEMVAENRAGRLHPAQVDRLRRKMRNHLIQGAFFAVPLFSLLLLILSTKAQGLFCFVLLLGGSGSLAVVGFGRLAYRVYQEIQAPLLSSANGWVAKEMVKRVTTGRHARTYILHYLKTPVQDFVVAPSVYNAFTPGQYAVYYFSRSKDLLSLEKI